MQGAGGAGRLPSMVAANAQYISSYAGASGVVPARSVLPVKPEWIRLPLPSARCPYTGLSRTTLTELSVPCEANGRKPPVESKLLRKRGSLRGIRLLNYDSLMAYLHALPNASDEEGGMEE